MDTPLCRSLPCTLTAGLYSCIYSSCSSLEASENWILDEEILYVPPELPSESVRIIWEMYTYIQEGLRKGIMSCSLMGWQYYCCTRTISCLVSHRAFPRKHCISQRDYFLKIFPSNLGYLRWQWSLMIGSCTPCKNLLVLYPNQKRCTSFGAFLCYWFQLPKF